MTIDDDDDLPYGENFHDQAEWRRSIPEYLAVLAEIGCSGAEVVWSEHDMALYRAAAE